MSDILEMRLEDEIETILRDDRTFYAKQIGMTINDAGLTKWPVIINL